MAQFSGTNFLGDWLYYVLLVPFIVDMAISGVNVVQETRNSATVTEVNEKEEDFIQSDDIQKD